MPKSRYVNFYLPEDVVDKIDKIASKNERSRNFVMKKILEKYFKEKKNNEI